MVKVPAGYEECECTLCTFGKADSGVSFCAWCCGELHHSFIVFFTQTEAIINSFIMVSMHELLTVFDTDISVAIYSYAEDAWEQIKPPN